MVDIRQSNLDIAYGTVMGAIMVAIVYIYFLDVHGFEVGLLGSGLLFDIWFSSIEAIIILLVTAFATFGIYTYFSERYDIGK